MEIKSNQKQGVSLIELLVVVAGIGAITSLSVPSFQSIIQDRKLNATSSEVARAVVLACSEAMKRGVKVFISVTDASNTTNEWGKGFRAWFGTIDKFYTTE